jgi:hypothetical protein
MTLKYNYFRCLVVLISANTLTINCVSLFIQSYDLAFFNTSLILTVYRCFPTSPCYFLEFRSLYQKFEPSSNVPPNEYASSVYTWPYAFYNQEFSKNEDFLLPTNQSLVLSAKPLMHISVSRLRGLLSCGSIEFRKVY